MSLSFCLCGGMGVCVQSQGDTERERERERTWKERERVLKLQTQTNMTNNTQHQDTETPIHKILPTQIIKTLKENDLTYWNETTEKQSKLECYLTLNRDYTTAEYLSTVKDCKLRRQMTRYRLSGHTLTIETGRYRQHWLPRESRICPNCTHGEVETEQHFLTSCYEEIRKKFYLKFEILYPDFKMLNKKTQLQYLLDEKQDCILLAARYIDACHKKREESTNQWCAHTHKHKHTHTHTHTPH